MTRFGSNPTEPRPFRSNADTAPHLGEVCDARSIPTDRATTMVLRGPGEGIPAYSNPSEGADRLLVLLPGALDRTRYDFAFQRASWSADFDAHVVAVSDPTIMASPSASLGWFQGTNGHPVFEELAEWILTLGSRLGVDARRTVIYGSSAGGFVGLELAEHLPQTAVVAVNPQLFVDRYERSHVEAMLQISYPTMSIDQVLMHHSGNIRVDPAILYRSAPCCIVQNLYDRAVLTGEVELTTPEDQFWRYDVDHESWSEAYVPPGVSYVGTDFVATSWVNARTSDGLDWNLIEFSSEFREIRTTEAAVVATGEESNWVSLDAGRTWEEFDSSGGLKPVTDAIEYHGTTLYFVGFLDQPDAALGYRDDDGELTLTAFAELLGRNIDGGSFLGVIDDAIVISTGPELLIGRDHEPPTAGPSPSE